MLQATENPSLAAALENEREATLDLAESKAIELIKEGDSSMIRFFLATLGKHRGYVTKQEVSADVSATGGVVIFLPDNGRDTTQTASLESRLTDISSDQGSPSHFKSI